MISKYRIDESQLHKKKLGKHTLTDVIVKGRYSTTAWAGQFYHYTSPEGLKGILQNLILFFTDCQYLNDTSERLSINTEIDKFWYANQKNYDKDFFQLIKDIRVDNFEDAGFSY